MAAGQPPGLVITLCADLARAHQVTLVAHEDDGSVGLALPQQQAQLRCTVETASVRQ